MMTMKTWQVQSRRQVVSNSADDLVSVQGELDNMAPVVRESPTEAEETIADVHSMDTPGDAHDQGTSGDNHTGLIPRDLEAIEVTEVVEDHESQVFPLDDETRDRFVRIIVANCIPWFRVLYFTNPYRWLEKQGSTRSRGTDVSSLDSTCIRMPPLLRPIFNESEILTRARDISPGVLDWEEVRVSWEPSVIPFYITLRYCFSKPGERPCRRIWLICADDDRPIVSNISRYLSSLTDLV